MFILQLGGSSGYYIVIETVVVKFWTNKGQRGCNNPTKTSTHLPSVFVLPSHIIQNDGLMVFVHF
jgi:hypothetical protein